MMTIDKKLMNIPVLTSVDLCPQVQLDRERSDRSAVESQLREKGREIQELQSRYDSHSYELNAK